jgi:restriction system protein
MAIPTYQQVMLPLLQYAADKQEHAVSETYDYVASVFNVSTQDRSELLPSGYEAIFDNRVRWGLFYLKKAGLLESSKRSFFRITEDGLTALNKHPNSIDVKFLKQYPKFVEFMERKREDKAEGEAESMVATDQTPVESMENAYQQLRLNLARELLDRLKACSPSFFERIVVKLLVAMGYGGSIKDAGQALGKSGDEGIDGTIKEDPLGLDVVYVQAKRWEATVGRPEIQKFVGALHGQRARRGVFITTADFSREAVAYASQIEDRVVLINGETLAQLMIDHGIGVSRVVEYQVKQVDLDYFIEE